ncbi:MAG: rhodanese-like domain-containing protein [Candidatus Schekmanbacteria bacterium]|nr:rhodanese-like domain-containing protein [Candidatus Schekmanbacteria bacterium]
MMRFLHSLQPNRRWIQVMVASCLCLCGGCGNREAVPLSSARPVTELRSNLPDRDIALARDLLRRGAVLLDVRTPEEYAREHLPNAILMPESDIAARLGEVGALAGNDLDRPILVYCAAGVRAARAKEILLRAGYRNVSNTGGLADWKDADRSGGSDRAPSSAEREEGAGGIYRDC